jgi:hypothetical protein
MDEISSEKEAAVREQATNRKPAPMSKMAKALLDELEKSMFFEMVIPYRDRRWADELVRFGKAHWSKDEVIGQIETLKLGAMN